jgi:hypothetical protein
MALLKLLVNVSNIYIYLLYIIILGLYQIDNKISAKWKKRMWNHYALDFLYAKNR